MKNQNEIGLLHLNCHRMHTVKTNLEVDMNRENVDVLLLQEPALSNRDQISFSRNVCGSIIYAKNCEKPRTCIVISKRLKQNVTVLDQFNNRNLTVVKLTLRSRNFEKYEMVIASIYLEQEISNEDIEKQLTMLQKYATDNNCRLFIGGDFNSHHPLWGSCHENRKIRIRGEKLFECFCSLNLNVLNDGSITYRQFNSVTNKFKESAIDLTLVDQQTYNDVKLWHVKDYQHYGSDHLPVYTVISIPEWEKQKFRDIKDLNHVIFREYIEAHLSDEVEIDSFEDLNEKVNSIGRTFKDALEAACPYKYRENKQRKSKIWYNAELKKKRNAIWKLS